MNAKGNDVQTRLRTNEGGSSAWFGKIDGSVDGRILQGWVTPVSGGTVTTPPVVLVDISDVEKIAIVTELSAEDGRWNFRCHLDARFFFGHAYTVRVTVANTSYELVGSPIRLPEQGDKNLSTLGRMNSMDLKHRLTSKLFERY
jgi:hypothetical protein